LNLEAQKITVMNLDLGSYFQVSRVSHQYESAAYPKYSWQLILGVSYIVKREERDGSLT
jgi:hypothetical protein